MSLTSIFSKSSEYCSASKLIFIPKVFLSSESLSFLCLEIPYQKLIVYSSILYRYIESFISDFSFILLLTSSLSEDTLIIGDEIRM